MAVSQAGGPVMLVSPLVGTYPLVTVVASALMLHGVALELRIAFGAPLTVAGVVLLLVSWAQQLQM